VGGIAPLSNSQSCGVFAARPYKTPLLSNMSKVCTFCRTVLAAEDDGTHASKCPKLNEILGLHLPQGFGMCHYCSQLVPDAEFSDHLMAHEFDEQMHRQPRRTTRRVISSSWVPPDIE
jgi:phage FluMu protein Com